LAKKRKYIGLATTFHDPAIAILDENGKVLFAEAAERFLQYKRAAFCDPAPVLYLPEILKNHVSPDDEIILATSWGSQFTRFLEQLSAQGQFDFDAIKSYETALNSTFTDAITERALVAELHYAQARAGLSILITIHRTYGHKNVSLRRYGHHDCHAAYACYSSPFNEAACLIVDGFGETSASAIYEYRDNVPHQIKRFSGKESIGFFFGRITELCGWDPARGEEWKVMGLAPYGKENPELRALIDDLWKSNEDKQPAPGNADSDALSDQIKSFVEKHGQSARADLAFEGQRAFEHQVLDKLKQTENMTTSDNIVFSGGCALNSSFNGKVLKNSRFQSLYVPSAPADDGNAIGAAMLAYRQDNPDIAYNTSFQSPYLGKDLSDTSLDRIADRDNRVKFLGEDVITYAAQALAQGKLVGWVQGRAEFGPRALGNRSILADPRPQNAKDMINAKVKYREAFRPFAPSILHDYGEEWFENYQPSPYMERTLKFRKEIRNLVPAVVHQDATGRLQSVRREWNPRYYDLIEAFRQITGIPLLLNTSFNIMGKPILHSAEDALLMFYTTGIDVLVIGDYLIEK